MALKKETVFRKNQVIPFLKTLKNTKFFPIQQMAIIGDLDFHLCCRGRFVALELKAEEGELAELQKFNLAEVERTYGMSLVASPKNWAKVRNLLKRLDAGEL